MTHIKPHIFTKPCMFKHQWTTLPHYLGGEITLCDKCGAERIGKPSFLQRALDNWDLILVVFIVLMLIGIMGYILMTY